MVWCARNLMVEEGRKEKRTGGERSVKGTCEKATVVLMLRVHPQRDLRVVRV
jgi:hypothetical protein